MKHANSLDIPQNHPFGERPVKKPSGHWGWGLALVLAGLFIYRSTRPVMRLSAEPPPAFYGHNRTQDRQERLRERRLALAYWCVAVRRIQRYYSPGKPLPADPPPQFRISDASSPLETSLLDGRVHYWNRLRKVWKEGNTWVVSYGWNTGWVEKTMISLPHYLPRSVTGIVQGFVDFFNDVAQHISYQ